MYDEDSFYKLFKFLGADQCARVDNSPCGGIPHDRYAVGIYRLVQSLVYNNLPHLKHYIYIYNIYHGLIL